MALDLGNAAEGAQVLGLGLLQIEFGVVAAVEQPFGDLEAALLQFGVVAGDLQARLGGAQGEIAVGHLRAQQHQHVFVVGLGGEVAGVGGLDGTTEAAPEVQLPAHVETGTVLPETAVLRIAPTGLVAVQVQAVGAGLLHLRVAAALGDAQLGAGFDNPQAGNLQARVVRIGLGDQAVEHRVGEHRPPLLVVSLRLALAGLLEGRAVPVLDPGHGLGLEVRAQAHAATQAKGRQ